MAINPHTPPPTPNVGYETRDANPASIVKFGVGLAILLIVVAIGMRWVFGFYAHTQNLGPAASPFENARTLPPSPRLQVTPQADIHSYWEKQQEILNSYGWVDEHNGVVRIPIDRAMRLVIERGLPAREAQPQAAKPDASASGESKAAEDGTR